MPTLEIITIGTELLLGEIADTNSAYIARTLRDHGIDIYRITTIGDNPARISATVKEAAQRAEIIITTGGLGPTVDDPTRQAVADAVGQELVFSQVLWEQIIERFRDYGRQPTENNRRQAYIPKDAIPIHNPVGTAPCFIVEIGDSCIISLPGVPREMETILHQSTIPYLCQKYDLKSQIIKATILHAASIGESAIDERIADLEQLSNPTVGLLAHPGQVDIRVTAKAASEQEAIELSQPVIAELKARLGDHIYGQDGETLEVVIAKLLSKNNLSLSIVENCIDSPIGSRFESENPVLIHHTMVESTTDRETDLINLLRTFKNQTQSDLAVGFFLTVNKKVSSLFIFIEDENTIIKTQRYGGPREYASIWNQNLGLDFLRKQIKNITGLE